MFRTKKSSGSHIKVRQTAKAFLNQRVINGVLIHMYASINVANL